eukprot:6015718-Amphidinium_carterae.1
MKGIKLRAKQTSTFQHRMLQEQQLQNLLCLYEDQSPPYDRSLAVCETCEFGVQLRCHTKSLNCLIGNALSTQTWHTPPIICTSPATGAALGPLSLII